MWGFSGVCSFSWNFDIFHVNSKKLRLQAPQGCARFAVSCANSWRLDYLSHSNTMEVWKPARRKTAKIHWNGHTPEIEVWIDNFNAKARKTMEHKLHKIWRSLKFCTTSGKRAHHCTDWNTAPNTQYFKGSRTRHYYRIVILWQLCRNFTYFLRTVINITHCTRTYCLVAQNVFIGFYAFVDIEAH